MKIPKYWYRGFTKNSLPNIKEVCSTIFFVGKMTATPIVLIGLFGGIAFSNFQREMKIQHENVLQEKNQIYKNDCLMQVDAQATSFVTYDPSLNKIICFDRAHHILTSLTLPNE